MKKYTKAHILIIFDGITNSVFQGQVLLPFLQQHKNDGESDLHLISFEPTPIAPALLPKNLGKGKIHIFKRLPYLGSFCVIYHLKKMLRLIDGYTKITITARGPFAALLAYKITETLGPQKCDGLTIQARGILTDEYRISIQHITGFKRLVHQLRMHQFAALEKKVYYSLLIKSKVPTTIQVVSVALKEYLIQSYGTPPTYITLGMADIPQALSPDLIQNWRSQTRTELDIPHHAIVYVYNGSAKTWQCPQETLHFFNAIAATNGTAYLLILTQDIEAFKALINMFNTLKNKIRIASVEHAAIYQYLAAADYGLIFRANALTNWVSRPTKILEYRAVGLPIIHNGTIEMLQNASDATIQKINIPS